MKWVLPIVHLLLEAFCVNICLAPHVLPERLEHRIIACGESHLKDTSLSRGESTGFGILHRDVLFAYLVHEELSALDEFLLDRIVHLVFDSLEEAEQYYGCVISKYCEFDTAEKYRWSLMYMDRFYWKPKDRMISRIKDGSLFRDLGWKDWLKGLR